MAKKYDDSKVTDDGIDIGGGLVAKWPEDNVNFTIVVANEKGDPVESVNMGGPDPVETARWNELRDMMPDDALYFQPENAGDDGSDIFSFQVYRSQEKAMEAHPDQPILPFWGDDIGEPTFIDVEDPVLYWNDGDE